MLKSIDLTNYIARIIRFNRLIFPAQWLVSAGDHYSSTRFRSSASGTKQDSNLPKMR